MPLARETWEILRSCGKTDRRPKFKTEADVIRYWNRMGPLGFLNIRDATPAMVREIRTLVEKKP